MKPNFSSDMPEENMSDRKRDAEKLLYDLGLLEELKKYGTPHVIGSYVMDAMADRDLDIDVTNDTMSTQKLYQLTNRLLAKYAPVWYEAKEEVTGDGKTVWFHGFETRILGELWNVDIWFFDRETIGKAEEYCDGVKKELDKDPRKGEAVIQIKKDLMSRNLYSFDQYKSIDVYKGVLEDGILTTEEFLQRFEK